MDERKEINQKDLKKVILFKTLRDTLIYNIIIWSTLIILRLIITKKSYYLADVIAILIFTIIFDIYISLFLYYKNKEKEYSKIVNSILSNSMYIQVVPNNALPGYKTFVTDVLPKKVDGFFAILDEKNQRVKIVLKFPNDDEYYDFTYSQYKYFLEDYTILENSEKLNIEKVNEELMLNEEVNTDYQKITAKKIAAKNNLEYFPNVLGHDVKHKSTIKKCIYAAKGKYILLHPSNDGNATCPIEWYGSLNKVPFLILDNQSSFKEITNLSDILLQITKLYIKYIDEDIFIDSENFAIKLEDNICPGYSGKAKLVLTENTIRNKEVKTNEILEAKKYFINNFLDHYIGWNFGVAVKSNPVLEQELLHLNELVISKGLREPAENGFRILSEDVLPYDFKQT